MTSCALCPRPLTEAPYCKYHGVARQRLRETFKAWQQAYGPNLTWPAYLRQLSRLAETGQWVREAAERELKQAPREAT